MTSFLTVTVASVRLNGFCLPCLSILCRLPLPLSVQTLQTVRIFSTSTYTFCIGASAPSVWGSSTVTTERRIVFLFLPSTAKTIDVVRSCLNVFKCGLVASKTFLTTKRVTGCTKEGTSTPRVSEGIR